MANNKKTRVIIIAAGPGERWKNFRGTTKHLAKVENEVLIQRTAKQFLKYTDDVCIVGNGEDYFVEGAMLYVVKVHNTNWRDAGKFMSSKHLWINDGRTVLVFGDVWFSTEAVKKIMTDKDSLKFYLRSGASTVHSSDRPEIFGLAFDETQFSHINQTLLHLTAGVDAQRQAGWALYRRIVGPTANGLFANPHFTEINDWTQDFDFPEDLEKWEEDRKESRKKKS
jgi:hypothetical protein